MKYRLYIDEVGNSDLGSSRDPNHRYLSLTGIILDLEHVSTTVFPAIEALKHDYFDSHPDEPIILHRKELVNKKYPLADIIAHPSFRATLARREHQPLADNFGGKIAEILEANKYVRGPDGRIDNWGREWLP